MAEVQYDAFKDNWWLSVGGNTTGKIYRSLTQGLMFERWLACNVLENAKVRTMFEGGLWHPIEVHISLNGVYQSTDII